MTFLSKTSSLSIAAASLSLLVGVPAAAQDQERETGARQTSRVQAADDDYHGEIVVTAAGLERLDILAGTSVMSGEELQRNMAGQVGEVLAKLPGVSATSFSPGASRPVLRGFSGERVRVLTDGIGGIDASNVSADHAVSLDPLTAERIDVLRGPAVLLYGSSAIGGAVNIIDKRIPRTALNEPFHVDVLAGMDTAYDLAEIGGSLDVPIGGNFVAHVDGSYRTTNDVEVPGYAVAPALRADLLADSAIEEAEGEFDEANELREAANQRGFVPNTATETWSTGAGLAFIGDKLEVGASFSVFDTAYGIPGRPGVGHHHAEGEDEPGDEAEEEGEENVSIGLRQYRGDFRATAHFEGSAFEELRVRAGYSDYTHTEFEGDEVGTVFDVTGFEARAELAQRRRGNWGGSLGGQFYTRDFQAVGAEAYIAPNTTDQFALFTLQELDFGGFGVEAAARWEHTEVAADTLGVDRRFDTFSGALGGSYDIADGLALGANLTRATRAPSAEELFANGPHIATQAFEIGDTDLREESAWGAEGYLRGAVGPAEISVAVYKNWFDDYIYLNATGAEEDGLPVYSYLQQDAQYFGVEGEVTLPLADLSSGRIVADVSGDYVRATLDDGTPIPRIPPLSLLGGLEWQGEQFDARAEVEWFAKQDRIAPEETATEDFTMVNASLAWKPLRGNNSLTVLAKVDNIFDVNGRRHASFTKDFVPLAGRNFKLSLRSSF
ncbi:TonB-dependent receptor [Altererythrobacter sp. CAU 1778]